MLAWEDIVARSVLTCPPGGWKPVAIAAAVEAILAEGDRSVERRRVGESFEGRPIELLTVGNGPRRVLMWSQMHGDEPTHTSVLLNLLRMLVASDTPAERLLRGLTIGMIVPLNPDGAERNTRHNAQGVDVNRDALAFASPEGRALREAVESFRPDYAFNLHNQHHRTAIGAPPQPAAVSLLVPPLDPEDTQTDTVRAAVQLAATFCERVRDAAQGRVSRYDADFMARAFGEWVQRQRVPVILVEAGGWPGGDFVVLERIHLAGLAQTLDAAAATALGEPGGLEAAEADAYLTLQRSSPYHLFDLLVSGAGVAQLAGPRGECVVTRAEVGVDYPHRKAGWYEFHHGVVRALGDLHENGGLEHVETDALVLPGRIVLAEEGPDAFDTSPADWDLLASLGATTALVGIDLGADDVADRVESTLTHAPPLNAALVGRWETAAEEAVLLERLTVAFSRGLVAVVGDAPTDDTLDPDELAAWSQLATTILASDPVIMIY